VKTLDYQVDFTQGSRMSDLCKGLHELVEELCRKINLPRRVKNVVVLLQYRPWLTRFATCVQWSFSFQARKMSRTVTGYVSAPKKFSG